MRSATLFGLLMLTACGAPEVEGRGGFDFSILLQRAVADDTSSLQVAILKGIAAHPCESLVNQCLAGNASVSASSFVRLYDDATGEEHRAIRIPLTTEATTGQELTFRADVGTDYRVVVEALSRDATPKLVGTSCTPLAGGVRQSGTRLPANPLVIYTPYLDCDPRIEP